MKEKLLFVISQLYSGGAERSLVNLLKGLSNEKYDVDLLILNQFEVTHAKSLIPEVPKWVNVCDAYFENKMSKNISRVTKKLFYTEEQMQKYFASAYQFVYGKKYNWAFHIGEWFIPDFVAENVYADKKAIWFHTDINEAKYFNEEGFFMYTEHFDAFIFVSQNSLDKSCSKYPFIREKSVVVHNISDIDSIRKKAATQTEDMPKINKPVILTVANIRPEKNHMRQLEVMNQLKQRGIDFQWWNVGAKSDVSIVKLLEKQIKEYGLEEDFLLLGAKENPYPYIATADIIACLSDYESWSMVISEAKVLEKPIIATQTSGALEQIENRKNGLLTDFNETAMVDLLEELLTDIKLQKLFSENLREENLAQCDADQFIIDLNAVKDRKTADILYVIDDINFQGGAHIASKNQINMLIEFGKSVDIFSSVKPSVDTRKEFKNVNFYSWLDLKYNAIYHQRFLNCMFDANRSKEEKKYKYKMSMVAKKNMSTDIFGQYVYPKLSECMSRYKTVCVMSEGSIFKEVVANSTVAKKIQWIHTDYCAWKAQTEFGRIHSRKDADYWENYDMIVVLSDSIKEKLASEMPEISDKIFVVPNFMDSQSIIELSNVKKNEYPPVSFVTVCRFEYVKAIPRLLKILKQLNQNGYSFNWTFVGDGEEYSLCTDLAQRYGLNECINFVGSQKNPYPYIKQADVFALFSYYEGLPNTIYEALILGVPVCATNVGGISDQVIPLKTGWLAENDEESIYEVLVHICENQEEIDIIKNELKNYSYDNQSIQGTIKTIFD